MAELLQNQQIAGPWSSALALATSGGGDLVVPVSLIRYFGFNPTKQRWYVKVMNTPEDHEYGLSETEYLDALEVLFPSEAEAERR